MMDMPPLPEAVVQWLLHLIHHCVMLWMTKEQATEFLSEQFSFARADIVGVWEMLESTNLIFRHHTQMVAALRQRITANLETPEQLHHSIPEWDSIRDGGGRRNRGGLENKQNQRQCGCPRDLRLVGIPQSRNLPVHPNCHYLEHPMHPDYYHHQQPPIRMLHKAESSREAFQEQEFDGTT